MRPHVGTSSSFRQLRRRPLARIRKKRQRACVGNGMTPLTTVAAPYKPRHVRFVRREEVAGWQLKLYGIALNGKEPDAGFVEATRDLAAAVLPQPPAGDDHYGVAFATAHDATSALHRARLLVAVGERAAPAHLRQPEGRPDRVRPGREPARRLRVGARDRRTSSGARGSRTSWRTRTAPTSSATWSAASTQTSRSGPGGEVLGEQPRARPQPLPERALEVLPSLLGERGLRALVAQRRRIPPLAASAPLELAEHHRRRRARTPIFCLTPFCSIFSLSLRSKDRTEQAPAFFPRGGADRGAPSQDGSS